MSPDKNSSVESSATALEEMFVSRDFNEAAAVSRAL